MYGWDATIPVARTDIGNIVLGSGCDNPMINAARAIKGAEILELQNLGVAPVYSAGNTAYANAIYCIGEDHLHAPGEFTEAADRRSELTIVDSLGAPIICSRIHHDIVSARIPIAEFRAARHTRPMTRDLLYPVFQRYEAMA